jgi:glycosyltransferase involved in cell wall biosynthesis
MSIRVTILSRYSRLGASSRLRTMQYLPALTAAGMDVTVASFFDDAYLHQLYAGQRTQDGILSYFATRLKQCSAARHADVIWVEKEAFPWLPWVVERLALPRGVPVVADYDDAVFHRYDMHRNPIVRAVLGKKIDKVMANSSLVTVGNAYLADRARAAGAHRVEIVPTVVDTMAYKPGNARRIDDIVRIGWMGTPLTWQKYGLPMVPLFESLAQRHKVRFSIVGASLNASSSGVFDYQCWHEHTEVSSLQAMDIGIMPLMNDPWERGKCGYKLIQYMACGLPVVASPVGVNTTIVEPGVNGFLASTKSEWCEALDKLIENKDLRVRMGAANLQKIADKYSIQAWSNRIVELLLQAAYKRNSSAKN